MNFIGAMLGQMCGYLIVFLGYKAWKEWKRNRNERLQCEAEKIEAEAKRRAHVEDLNAWRRKLG